jgi:nitroimidazol reductase NimA-like FMN-containing flavoprotein (pyridoxamine 5'-phosphate oxidase superfamily)
MKPNYDEPMCNSGSEEIYCSDDPIEVEDEIKHLVNSQSFAVLSTQGEGQPYASLISFAASNDLKYMIFATQTQTRKYGLLLKSDKIALMVDNRANSPPSINKISAVTVTGRSRILEDPTESEKWSKLLLEKHPYLKSFVKTPSTSLVLIKVYRYFYVRRFQEVSEWNPNQG